MKPLNANFMDFIYKNKGKQQYLILGSASRELIKQSSETLAGRIAFIELGSVDIRAT